MGLDRITMMLVGVKEYNVDSLECYYIGVLVTYIPCTFYCMGRHAWGCRRPYIQILFLGCVVSNPTIAS